MAVSLYGTGWYCAMCTTNSAVGTGGCDVHGTGGRRDERWLCLCVVQVGIVHYLLSCRYRWL